MKVEREYFEPITLTITIESMDELLALWHRTNIADVVVREYSIGKDFPSLPVDLSLWDLWVAVNDIWGEYDERRDR